MPTCTRELRITVLTALVLGSGCARLIGADFDRTGQRDGGADKADSKTNEASTSNDAGDAGDGSMPPKADGGDADTDGGQDSGEVGDASDPDAGESGSSGACGQCPNNQLCCDKMCKPIDAANCFACDVVCSAAQPACAADVQACVCTDTSCPDGQVCVAGTCLRSSVVPMTSPQAWNRHAFFGNVQTSFADVNNDGRADAIAVNDSGITVALASKNGSFVDYSWTTTGPFSGARGTFFADVTGDGCADAIAQGNANVIVRRSNCKDAFGESEVWGPRDDNTWLTAFADTNGDGCADLIDVEGSQVIVRVALPCPAPATTTAQFNPTLEPWTNGPFYGSRGWGTYFADVTGDGKADAIAVVDYGVWTNVVVRRSDGTTFLENEQWWIDQGLGGGSAYVFADVTGDRMADLVVVMADGAYMLRSNRWFFGERETLSNVPFSPSSSIRGDLFASTDVTGDGRADLIQVGDNGLSVSVTVDRRIPLRFVQLVDSGAAALPDDQLQAAVIAANQVYRSAGVQFFMRSSDVVTSAALSDLTKPGSASMTDLSAATNTFNPTCDLGTDLAGASVVDQMQVIAARCALDAEILVYVTRIGSSTGLLPWEGKAFFMNPADLTPAGASPFRLAHELGHYLGLPHTFACCGDSPLSHPDLVVGNLKDVNTGLAAPLSRFWDLVYAPSTTGNIMFNSADAAAALEASLAPIQATGTTTDLTSGWYCPSGDATRTCDASAPAGTICLQVSDPRGQTKNYCSGNPDLKGLGLRLADDTPAINVMSFGYPPPVPDPTGVTRRPPALSLSQIEQIHRTLTSKIDIDTPIQDPSGRVIKSGRPLLGR